jgi:ArsR family transcriptional regulator, arsenate/arsenite/antimonite-responsive transcriptional repressor
MTQERVMGSLRNSMLHLGKQRLVSVVNSRFHIDQNRSVRVNKNVSHNVMPMTDKQLVLALKAVADPARVKILRLLKQKGQCSIGKGVGMCACDVQDHVTLSQPTISHHMSILRKAGLVQAEKHGLWMWYRRNEKSLKELAHAVSAEL